MVKIPAEYAKDARTVSAYNKGHEEGYYGKHEITEANFASQAEAEAFAIGRKTGELKRKEFENE